MVTSLPDPDGDPQLQALTTLTGWRQFATEMPAVPRLLDRQVWQSLDPDKRAAYDDDRIAHHSGCWWCRLRRSARWSPPGGGWPT